MINIIRRSISSSRKTMAPPDRWDVYSPLGKVIPGTKFIAFKVPLKEEQLQKTEQKDRFSPSILMKLLSDQDLKLGGVIDLTFTHKYYNSEEFLKHSVGHKKIFTAGHVVPSEEVFQEFAHAVRTFETQNHDCVIGVHCTHGVNRTGYLICRYMIEEMNYEPDEAIALFNEARGHNLERDNYLEDLKCRKRGQSICDPNFKLGDIDPGKAKTSDSQRGKKKKPRWKHHRDDHPEWRRKHHHETGSPRIDCEPEASGPSSNVQAGRRRSQNLEYDHHDWSHEFSQKNYFVDRMQFRDRSSHVRPGFNSRDDDYSSDRLDHGGQDAFLRRQDCGIYSRNNSRNLTTYEGYNPRRMRRGHRGYTRPNADDRSIGDGYGQYGHQHKKRSHDKY